MKIICFAGPNGSGKSTLSEAFITSSIPFVNADIIAQNHYSHITNPKERNLLAAQHADKRREELLEKGHDFAFETVLSDITSNHNKLDFLKRAKEKGATITTVYVLTRDKEINVRRIWDKRVPEGGHPVPVDKIRSRYDKCLKALPQIIHTSDQAFVYDNSLEFNTYALAYKNGNDIALYSNSPQEDKFLQQRIVQPLQKGFNYNIEYYEALDELGLDYSPIKYTYRDNVR